MGLNETDVFLVTRPREEWREPDVGFLQRRIREKLDVYPGLLYGFTQPIDMRVSEMISGVSSDVAIRLLGDELEVLEELSQRIEATVSRTAGAVDVSRTPLQGQMYLSLAMKHAELSRLGVSVKDVNELVSTAVGGVVASEVIEGTRRTPILVRFPEAYRDSAAALARLRLTTPVGATVLLGDLVHIREQDGPVQIEREDGRRQVVVSANVEGRDVVGFVEEVRRRVDRELLLPPGYFVQYDGQFANQARAARRLALVVPVSLFVIFMILLSTFRSVRQALLILCNVPLAFIGGVLLLYLSGAYLSVPASVGFIALLGLAVMNGVVLINTFNQLREDGGDLRRAVEEGCLRRLRPVLMTAILTVLGLIPLLLATGPGSEVQKPLAIVVIGGTFSSTFLTLIFLPTVYVWLEARKRAVSASSTSSVAGSSATP
jgi:cobalt-zinc-cadmium resistance protein CzcA